MKNPHTHLRIAPGPGLDGHWRLETNIRIGLWPWSWRTWQLLPFKFASQSEAQTALNLVRYYVTGTYTEEL